MYEVKQFSVAKLGKTDTTRILKMYQQIADYANKKNLKIVTVSKPEDSFGFDSLTAIFESKE